jgi:hypothetical protein
VIQIVSSAILLDWESSVVHHSSLVLRVAISHERFMTLKTMKMLSQDFSYAMDNKVVTAGNNVKWFTLYTGRGIQFW